MWSITFPSNTIPANSTTPVTITLTAATANTLTTPQTFTVRGTSDAAESILSATLAIGAAGTTKNISLVLTVPVEGDNNTLQPLQPIFTFKLYNAQDAQVYTNATPIRTTADKVTLAINALSVGGTYHGFIRSNRHLWQAGTAPITVGAADSYTMSFNRLVAGDLNPDNTINAVDAPAFLPAGLEPEPDLYQTLMGMAQSTPSVVGSLSPTDLIWCYIAKINHINDSTNQTQSFLENQRTSCRYCFGDWHNCLHGGIWQFLKLLGIKAGEIQTFELTSQDQLLGNGVAGSLLVAGSAPTMNGVVVLNGSDAVPADPGATEQQGLVTSLYSAEDPTENIYSEHSYISAAMDLGSTTPLLSSFHV